MSEQKREYFKIREEEKHLSVACKTSDEFYKRYKQEIGYCDVVRIGKIWARRSEFKKKLLPENPKIIESIKNRSSPDIEALMIDLINRISILIDIEKDILKEQQTQTRLFLELAKKPEKHEPEILKHTSIIPEDID